MNTLGAVLAAFKQHWKTTTFNFWSLSFFIGSLPAVVIYAWIALQAPDPSVLSYLIVGVPMGTIWHSVFFGIASGLSSEIWGGTIEFTMISRTPMVVALFGKSLAMMAFGIPAGLTSLAAMLIVARRLPDIASFPWVLVSLVIVFIGLAVTALVMSPIIALARGRTAGMFTPMLPVVVALSGFMFPISSLPFGLKIVSRFLPSSWGMTSVEHAIMGPESAWAVVSGLLMSLMLSAALLALTLYLYKLVERRLRIRGTMSY